jgi:hypothetical protein
MDSNQLQQARLLIDEFFNLDLNESTAAIYDPKIDAESHRVGKYNLAQYKTLVRRVFEHFKAEFKSEIAIRLPYQYNFQNEYGSGNIQSDLRNLINQIIGRQFPPSVQFLDRLIAYQAQNGFWERSIRKYHKPAEVQLTDAQDKIKTTLSAAEKLNNEYAEAIQKIEIFLDDSAEKINRYNAQIEEISNLLEGSRHRSEEITNTRSEASVLLEKISSSQSQSSQILENHKDIFDTSRKILESSEEILKSVKIDHSNVSEKFTALIESINSKEEFIESKNDFFVERLSYLNDLIGSEVGASLFNTFKVRKDELNSGVLFWTWGVGLTAVLTVVWVVFLFYNVDIDKLTVGSWLATTLKSLPAILILFFAIAQYSRERSYQEEYAFKSAVALTLKAYADQLNSDDNHDALIISAVEEVFRSPQITHKSSKTESDGSVQEALKGMTDISKTVVNKIKSAE